MAETWENLLYAGYIHLLSKASAERNKTKHLP